LSSPPRRDRHPIAPSFALSLLGDAFGLMIWLPIPERERHRQHRVGPKLPADRRIFKPAVWRAIMRESAATNFWTSRLRRLEQGVRLAEHRTVVLDWLNADPNVTLDAVAEKLAKVSTRATPSEADGVHQPKQHVKQPYRPLADQGLLETNEFAALVEFAKDKAAAFDLPRESYGPRTRTTWSAC
jgi:hypothetical protein